MKYRKKLFPILILLFTGTLWAGTPQELAEDLGRTSQALENASWSVYARYADTGETLIDINSDLSLATASGLKLVTTAGAILELGPDFRYETRWSRRGEMSGRGTLNGDLVLTGSGDPVLGSDWVPDAVQTDSLIRILIKSVQKAGIRKVSGDLIIDISIFDDQIIPNDWIWTDIGNYYGAGIWGFNIANNLYHITFTPGDKPGDPAAVKRIEPRIPGLNFINYMKTGPEGSGDNGYIYCAPRAATARLRGTIPMGFEEFTIKGSMPDPPQWFGNLLKGRLYKAGIYVRGSVKILTDPVPAGELTKLAVIASPPMSRIIEITNKRSVNMFTEGLLKTVSVHRGDGPATADAVKSLKALFESEGIDLTGFDIKDGSGLSRSDMVRTRHFADILALMSTKPEFEIYHRSFSLCGDPDDLGWLQTFGKDTPAAMNARIKTGYIENVRSHSGYVRTRSGRLVTFAMFANNFTGSTAPINKIHEQIVVALSELE